MSAPDWNVAVVNGQPEVVLNAAGVAVMVCANPLGPEAGLAVLRDAVPPEFVAPVKREVRLLLDARRSEGSR